MIIEVTKSDDDLIGKFGYTAQDTTNQRVTVPSSCTTLAKTTKIVVTNFSRPKFLRLRHGEGGKLSPAHSKSISPTICSLQTVTSLQSADTYKIAPDSSMMERPHRRTRLYRTGHDEPKSNGSALLYDACPRQPKSWSRISRDTNFYDYEEASEWLISRKLIAQVSTSMQLT